MPPKADKKGSKKAKPEEVSGKKPAMNSRKPKKESAKEEQLPPFAFFTIKTVEFNRTAGHLAKALKETYGEQTTISQFEKFVAGYTTLKPSEKELVYLDKGILDMLADYRRARDARDTERRSFRGDVEVKDITAGLEACLSALASESEEDEPPELEEDAEGDH